MSTAINGHKAIVIKSDGSNLTTALEASLALQQTKKEINLDAALVRRAILVDATKRLMVEGVDYGPIPGSDKPCLLQPGADKLCNLFQLVIEYEVIENVKDWTGKDHGGESFFYYEVRGFAYHRESGTLMGEGIGSCNSWESKYRWRKGERKCPACSADAIIKGREEYGGGWLCFGKKGGCGAKFKAGDKSIEGQEVGRIKNPDVCNEVNSIQKIALKRCKLSTTINATSASEFFTQDVEEEREPEVTLDPPPPPPPVPLADRPQPASPSKVQPAAVAPTPINTGAVRTNSKPWHTFKEMVACFAAVKAGMPWPMYYSILDAHGVAHSNQFKIGQQAIALKCFQLLEAAASEYQEKAVDPTNYVHFEVTEGEWQ